MCYNYYNKDSKLKQNIMVFIRVRYNILEFTLDIYQLMVNKINENGIVRKL